MTKDEPAPQWRNVAVWGAVGAIFYIVAVCAGPWILQVDGIGEIVRSGQAVAVLGLGLIFAVAVAGLSSRKRPVSLRNLRNYVIRDAVAILAFLLVLWGFSALARAGALGAMGASEWAAVATGSVLVVVASLGMLGVASVHAGADLIDDEVAADEMRERGRLIVCSLVWMVTWGLLLAALGLAGPGGVLSPAAALAGALVLIAGLIALGIAIWRMIDELDRTLSYETGNIAFYLVLLLGGGWAMLAHLGFVAAPPPLGWLTMFTVLLFAASFIAMGRRKLLTR